MYRQFNSRQLDFIPRTWRLDSLQLLLNMINFVSLFLWECFSWRIYNSLRVYSTLANWYSYRKILRYKSAFFPGLTNLKKSVLYNNYTIEARNLIGQQPVQDETIMHGKFES